jgi:hypothetical protein
MSKLNQALIILLVGQIALGVFLLWPRPGTAAAGQPLLADFSAADTVNLTISDSEKELKLAKIGEGWVLPERGNFPVNAETVTTLLDQVAKVQTGRLVTQTEGSHARLQVAADNFNRRLQISRADGGQNTLYLGSSGGVKANHVRANSQPEEYLTGELDPFQADPNPSRWIDTLYFTLPQSTTVAITLENQNGTFAFEKVGDNWVFNDLAETEIFDPNGLTTLLNHTHSIRMTEPVGLIGEAGDAFAAPLATVTIQNGGETYRLQVGAPDSEGAGYLFSASASPYYVRVSTFTGENILNKTRGDFLQAPAPVEEATDQPPGSE